MSAYSDWKCGAIDDDEYRTLSNWEARREAMYDALDKDEYSYDKEWEDAEVFDECD